MTTHERFGHLGRAVATVAFIGAAVACDGGAGSLGSSAGADIGGSPPTDAGYGASLDSGPRTGGVVPGDSGNAPDNGARPPAGGPGASFPGGGGGCEKLIGTLTACGAKFKQQQLDQFRASCAQVPAACQSCVNTFSCQEVGDESDRCNSPCGGPLGGRSVEGGNGQGGSSSTPGKDCGDVADALAKCSDSFDSPSARAQVKSLCGQYNPSCQSCVAGLPCSDLTKIASAGGKIQGTSCDSVCNSGTGSGSTTGAGGLGSGGSGAGSGGGDCVTKLLAKNTECDLGGTTALAQDYCANNPSCVSCLQAVPCASIAQACASICPAPQ